MSKMSKARDWAKEVERRIAWQSPAHQLESEHGRKRVAVVADDGGLYIDGEVHVDSEAALKLAYWIIETFGEGSECI